MSQQIESDSKKEALLVDPYAELGRNETMVTSIRLSDADRAFLFSLYPHQSVVQVTMATLLNRFVAAMKRGGITSYNPKAFAEALSGVKITVNSKKKGET